MEAERLIFDYNYWILRVGLFVSMKMQVCREILLEVDGRKFNVN